MQTNKTTSPNRARNGVEVDKASEVIELSSERSNRIFSRGHSLTKDQLAALTARHPDWVFKFGNGSLHPHPLGATERAISEQLVVEEITRKYGAGCFIVDIGGNANRHARAGRSNIHSCNPIISAADAVRRHPDNYDQGAAYCNLRTQDCPLIPDVYIAIHSLYYLSKEDILRFVLESKKNRLYAVVHCFTNLYGSFHTVNDVPESTYETFYDGESLNVHMRVHGNHTGYTHSACGWLFETNYYSDGQFAMAWTSTPVGDSYIIEFVATIPGLAQETARDMPLCTSLNRADHYGRVDGIRSYGDQAEFAPTLQALSITTGMTISCGPFTLTTLTSKKHILIPKDLVVHVSNDIIGLERNEKTLAMCVGRMRTALKKFNVPASMKKDCLTYGSAFAFIHNLDDELAAFNALCTSPMTKLYARLSNALSLGPLGCCSPTAEVNYENKRQTTANMMAKLYSISHTTPPIKGSFDARVAWPKGLPGYESQMPLSTIKAGAHISDYGEPDTKVYAPQLHVNAPIFTPIQAVVPNPSKNNEEKALVNRALVETYEEDPALWNEVHAHAKRLTRHFDEITAPFDSLFKLWVAKFPKAQRSRLETAYVTVKRRGLLTSDLIMKMFVKREVTLKSGESVEDFDPRAIQACTDELNAAYGPFIWACSKRLCAEWCLGERICYTSGMTAEAIGSWRKDFDGSDQLTIIELDESRYDAHQGRGMVRCSQVLKYACGIANYDLPSEVEGRTYLKSGRSRHFSYRVPGTMTSGKADTSVSNSFGNGVKLDYLLQKFGFKTSEYRMLVNGDDSLVVVDKSLSAARTLELQNFLVDENKKLGFKTKCKVRTEWHEVEYCSGLFWPVADGYVLGPKIGRRLPKLGFGITALAPSQVASMVEGMANDLSHIPVLSVYYKACVKLLPTLKLDKKKKQKEYVDKEAKYKWACAKKHQRTADTDVFFHARYKFSADLCEESLQETLDDLRTMTDCVHYPMMAAFEIDL
jgi:hypothetical protein